MNNGANTGFVEVGPSSTAYTAVGTGDFYGNGTSDILFRNNSTGDVGFYAISNGVDTGWHYVAPSSTAYTAVGVGDYFGNGTDDILFRNNASGDVGFYEINNGMDVGWVDVGPSSTAYNVVPDTSDNSGSNKSGGSSITSTGAAPVPIANGSASTSNLLYTPVAATGSGSWKESKPQTLASEGSATQWLSQQPVSAGVITTAR